MHIDPLPTTYRMAQVAEIADIVRAGESCTVVGIGSAGKSNLLRFLQRPDVRRKHLGEAWESYLIVYVDANKMLEPSTWGLMELMLHQLMLALAEHGVDDASVGAIDQLYQQAIALDTRFLALRYVDRALTRVRGGLGLRLVFLLDEFDHLCEVCPADAFAALRAYRDDHKYGLSYVVASRVAWPQLCQEGSEIEAFEELVSPHTIWLGPYAEEDARLMLRRLATRYGVQLTEGTIRQLVASSGRHPGLLRAGYRVAIEGPGVLTKALQDSARVQQECRRIWDSLEAQEQEVMTRLVSRTALNKAQQGFLERLYRKLVLNAPVADPDVVFSPLFRAYIEQQTPDMPLSVDRENRAVRIGNRVINGLPRLEYAFIEYLAQEPGKPYSRQDLIHHLYGQDVVTGKSDGRLDAIVKRLRQRIEWGPGPPRYILTEHGYGFLLGPRDKETG